MKRSAALTTALLALGALAAGCNQPGGAVELTEPESRGSYAQGFSIGEQAQGFPIDVDAFVQGFRDGLADNAALTPEERQQAMLDYRQVLEADLTEKAAAGAAAGEAYLAENGQRDGVTTTASGVQYEVLRQGDGPMPDVSQRVTVHYRGQTTSGEVFDESYEGGEPRTFGVTEVINGLSEGLQLMPVGSHYKFYIPGPLAYGPNPPPGSPIGPNDVLVFEIELIEIQ